MTRMTVAVSTRSNGVGDASQISGPTPGRHAVRLGIFLPFRDPSHDALHHLGRLPAERLRRLSLVAKPAGAMLIPGRAFPLT
jgi:hypothetical protein